MTILAVDRGACRALGQRSLTFLRTRRNGGLVALGYFDYLGGPRPRITFEATEPWCRHGCLEDSSSGIWVRVGVENHADRPVGIGVVEVVVRWTQPTVASTQPEVRYV